MFGISQAQFPKWSNTSEQIFLENAARDAIGKLAYLVIDGAYGNGHQRVARLGDLYGPVQARVEQILRESPGLHENDRR